MKNLEKLVNIIIEKHQVYTVYQPVVNLETGIVFGYEALMRPDIGLTDISVQSLFECAEKMQRAWELDKICRKRALKTAGRQRLEKKLFINVDPNIMLDPEFQEGFTKNRLEKYKIAPNLVVFELSERTAISNYPSFQKTLQHYRDQKFSIAIDDFGYGYSSLSLFCETAPEFIKIDISLIKGINKDLFKKNMVKSLVQIASSTNTKLIAEGIETKEDLLCLIELGVAYGQGFFLGRPCPAFTSVSSEAMKCITNYKKLQNKEWKQEQKKVPVKIALEDLTKNGARPVRSIANPGITFLPDTVALDILKLVREDGDIPSVTIIDSNQKVIGAISSKELLQLFGGQYGFSLNQRKTIKEIMDTEFLCVNEQAPIEEVSRLAMNRKIETLYDPVVLVDENKIYKGIVTVSDMLESIVEIEVDQKTLALRQTNSQLQQLNRLAERDLQMAAQVQKNFYPQKAPQTDKYDCAYLFKPMAAVSGDVYDFYLEDNNLLGLSLLDVSGHGISSGLVGILAKSITSRQFLQSKSVPLHLVGNMVNEDLITEKGKVENYVTGIILRFTETGFDYINAGHPDLLYTDGMYPCVKVEKQKDFDGKGRFMGISDLSVDFSTISWKTSTGSLLLAYSDCLVESRNIQGEEFGIERLEKTFNQAPKNSSNACIEYIWDRFQDFTTGVSLADDLTVMVVKQK